MSYSPAGRRRRRRRTIIASVLGLSLIAVAFGVTQAEGERELTRSYLDVVFEVVRAEATMATGFTELIDTIEEYDRARMAQALDELDAGGGASFERLVAAEPPQALLAAHSFLKIAVSGWRSGLSEARESLLALSANPVDEAATRALQRAVVDLLLGDRAYRAFVSEMVDVDTGIHGALPSVAFVPPGRDDLHDPTALARRLLLSPDLQIVVDLAVADLRIDPPLLGSRGGLPVVPAAESYAVEATIANRGNIEQLNVRVTLQLVSEGGLFHEEAFVISELPAGQATTVVFTPLNLSPGTTYELSVRVPGEDAEPANDRRAITFMVNPDD